MVDINSIWVDIECPNCKYIEEVQLVDIKSERMMYCHNCKCSIQLMDSDGSFHNGIENINSAFKALELAFKKFK